MNRTFSLCQGLNNANRHLAILDDEVYSVIMLIFYSLIS